MHRTRIASEKRGGQSLARSRVGITWSIVRLTRKSPIYETALLVLTLVAD